MLLNEDVIGNRELDTGRHIVIDVSGIEIIFQKSKENNETEQNMKIKKKWCIDKKHFSLWYFFFFM